MKVINNISNNDDVFGYIYVLKNDILNKYYVGLTTDIKARIRDYKYRVNSKDSCTRILIHDMREYGLSNFTFEVIDTALNKEELIEKEIMYISKYNSLKPNGYNSTTGGEYYISARSQTLKEKKQKSKKIVAYKDNKFIISDSAKLFADKVGLARTNVTEGIKKCKLTRDYMVFYLDKNERDLMIEKLKEKMKSFGPKHQHLIPVKLEMLEICKILDNGIEFIKKNYDVELLTYDESVETIERKFCIHF